MLYDYVEKYIADMFLTEKTLKETPRGTVTRLRHRESRRLYICRRFRGNIAPWQKLLSVRCAHLPRIYEAAQRDDRCIALEEYIAGDMLADLLEGGLMSPSQTKAIALQLADALYALHEAGLVHRDVKPENILLEGDRAVLIDFDAARENKPAQQQDTRVLGTLGYAAPEQYGISQTDARADIYALGVLLNVMLTGAHPSVRLAPGRFSRIIAKCTMISPGKRYQSIREFIEAI